MPSAMLASNARLDIVELEMTREIEMICQAAGKGVPSLRFGCSVLVTTNQS